MNQLKNIKLGIDKALICSLSIILFVMLFCVCLQVFSRYILKTPTTFTEELVRFLLMWVGMLGASYSFSTHKHLSLTLVFDHLPVKVKFVIQCLIILIVSSVAVGLLIYGGIKLMIIAHTQMASVLLIPMSYVYSVLPISGLLILFYQIYDLVNLCQNQWERGL